MTVTTTSAKTNDQPRVLQTRFGTIRPGADAAFTMPKGMIGFEDSHNFVLSAIPLNNILAGFMLLQSLDVQDLCFILAEYERVDTGDYQAYGLSYPQEHLLPLIEALNMNHDDVRVFGVAALDCTAGEAPEIHVNAQAPLFLDTSNRQGWQVIVQPVLYDTHAPFRRVNAPPVSPSYHEKPGRLFYSPPGRIIMRLSDRA